jgi:PAS domain S-box-containing protein
MPGLRHRGLEVTGDGRRPVASARRIPLSEQARQRSFAVSPVAMAISGLDGRFVDVNASTLRLFELPREQVLGRTSVELGLQPAGDREREALAARLREQGSVRDEPRTLRLPSGRERELTLHIDLIEVGGHRCYLSSFFDITPQKRAADALRKSEARLEEAQAVAHVGSWDWDLRTDAVTPSKELCRIVGMTPEELAASPWSGLDRVHPEDRGRLREEVVRAIHDKRPWELEYRLVRPDGVRCIQARGEILCDGEGYPMRSFGTAQDITERREVETRLIESDRMAALGTLAAGAAHEINNPLTTITANLGFIAEELTALADTAPPDRLMDLQAMTREARQAVERVTKIVGDLTVFSQADQHRRTPVDIRRVVQLAIDLAAAETRYRAQLVTDLGEVPLVEADEAGLCQVFINLLVNAAHAIQEGQADQHQIGVVTRTDAGGRAVVEVRDTGAGIARDTLGRVFNPFFTTKGIGAGRGLGLSVCHGIVKRLGGEITVESEPGKGTLFRVVLPPARLEPVAPAAGTTGTRRGRVLVIDDEPMVGNVIGRLLREHDATVVQSTREARERIDAGEHYDVILCDVMMPDMTGTEFHARLSRDFPELAAHLIFMTGGTFKPAEQEYLDSVPNQRLDKPFPPQSLRTMVERLLDSSTELPPHQPHHQPEPLE